MNYRALWPAGFGLIWLGLAQMTLAATFVKLEDFVLNLLLHREVEALTFRLEALEFLVELGVAVVFLAYAVVVAVDPEPRHKPEPPVPLQHAEPTGPTTDFP